jgi:hypothetical protein
MQVAIRTRLMIAGRRCRRGQRPVARYFARIVTRGGGKAVLLLTSQ